MRLISSVMLILVLAACNLANAPVETEKWQSDDGCSDQYAIAICHSNRNGYSAPYKYRHTC